MNTRVRCPIWETPAIEAPGNMDGRLIDSPRAGGRYFVSGSAEGLVESCENHIKIRITTWLIEQRRLGNSCPKITTNTIGEAQNWRDLTAVERADNILNVLNTKSKTLGTRISYNLIDIKNNIELSVEDKTFFELLAHSACIDEEDFLFLVRYLENQGLIEHHGALRYDQGCTVTIDGYARLDELDKTFATTSRAFVAMWFDESMSEAWQHGIAPAIRDAGYEPVRIDQQEHVNKIDDEIIAEIRRARFVVADFTQGDTGARGGVYYEAGFAHGLDIPVIFTCRADSLDKVHFDTRQYNHIVWTDPKELRQSLKNRIAAVIGDGPDKPPG